MKKKNIVKEIIRDFQVKPLPKYITRQNSFPLDVTKIITLIGARRSGKTYMLYQAVDRLLQSISKSDMIFINFEDERLDLNIEDLDLILQAYRELYPQKNLSNCYFFFDEIQNVIGWEKFVRRIYDSVSRHIFITGSNAKLLSSEISTSLRGRSISYEVFPLSFVEFLNFHKISFDFHSSQQRGLIYNTLEHFLRSGGFPELAFEQNDDIRNRILQEYFDVMLFRDLVERYEIKNIVALKFFLKRLFASATKQISVNRIFNDLKSAGIKIGKNSLYEYLERAEAIFLVQTLKKYSRKLSTREFGEQKIYTIDNGLLNSVVYNFSADTGKIMEQAVFLELRRRGTDLFYLKNGFECDFAICTHDAISNVLQVCYDLDDAVTRKREIKGLVSACRMFDLPRGTIVSWDEETVINIDGRTIEIIPLPRFLSNVYG